MPKLDTYQEWEQTSSRTTVHVIQIDRGDLAAAKRLTLTDKPYIDKGVSGTRYHDTYPAPIHCITSNLSTSEGLSRTSFREIELANGNGLLDSIASEYNIVGNEFLVLRGDMSWSLLETDYPTRFIEIFRGIVVGVLPQKNGASVRLRISPVDYNLDLRLGREGDPRGYGRCFNVPAQLVDSANHEYICNNYAMRDDDTTFALRDNGVDLVHPDDPGPDYSFVLSSSKFFGSVQLNSAPTGKVTADINMDYANAAFELVRRVLGNTVAGIELAIAESLDYSAVGGCGCMVNGEESYYIADYNGINGTIRQYTLSPAGDLSSSSGGSSTYDIYDDDIFYFVSIWVNEAEDRLYIAGQDLSADEYLFLYDFGTPGDPSTLVYNDGYDVTGLNSNNLTDLCLSVDESKIWLLFDDGTMYQLSQGTAGDLTSITDDEISQNFAIYDRQAWAFDVANSGKNLYIAGGSEATVMQFDLLTANTIEEIKYIHRAQHHFNSIEAIVPYWIHVSADNLFAFNNSFFINRSPLTNDYTLPRAALLHNVYDGQGEVEVGVWYGRPAPSGAVIKDIVKSLACEYAINRIGELAATQLKDPAAAASYEPVFVIYFGDFVGERSTYIQATKTIKAAAEVTQAYKRNFGAQDEDSLGGSLTEDEVFDYSTPVRHYTKTNSLAAYVESRDIVIDGFLSLNDSDAQDIADGQAALYDETRFEYVLTLNLKCTSLLTDFRVGSIIEVGDDWGNSDFTIGDNLQVIGREINWSRNLQKIRVFK